MTANKRKAPNAKQFDDSREEGNNRNTIKQLRNESVKTSISHTAKEFDPSFFLTTGRARIWVRPESLTSGEPVVELTDDYDSNMLLSPAETLSVAAALQAVATYLLEEPKQLRRKTEPGAPSFEEGI